MLHTTFRKAKEKRACQESYREMAKALGGVSTYGMDTPIPLDKILEVCGLSDTLWCLRITLEPCEREVRLLACDYAERVLLILEQKYPDDNRPHRAIETYRRFANGQAAEEQLDAARGAARDAAWVARAAVRDAAGGAERQWQTERLQELLNLAEYSKEIRDDFH